MLTFKKGSYNYAELNALYDGLVDAKQSFICDGGGCGYCIYCKPCSDLTRCQEYVWRLLCEMRNHKEITAQTTSE